MEKESKVERAWDRALTALGKHSEEIKRISRVGKLKIENTRLQKERDAVYCSLGVQTYRLLKESRFDPAELQELISKVDDVNELIENKKKEIDSIASQSQITRTKSS